MIQSNQDHNHVTIFMVYHQYVKMYNPFLPLSQFIFISLGAETNAVMYGQEKELIFAQPIAKYSSSHIESILLILNNASTLA